MSSEASEMENISGGTPDTASPFTPLAIPPRYPFLIQFSGGTYLIRASSTGSGWGTPTLISPSNSYPSNRRLSSTRGCVVVATSAKIGKA